MSSSSEPIAHRIYPAFTPPIQAQRAALEADMRRREDEIERLRIKEIGLRAELVSTLDHLQFNAARASLKIETRQWADGCAALDMDFEQVNEAQSALLDCLDDIRSAEWAIADQQGELDDDALWENN